jgi:phosphatidylserine decarboxylase
MNIHREGYPTLSWAVVILGLTIFGVYSWNQEFVSIAIAVAAILFILVIQFFRDPDRSISNTNDNIILSPADGKVVVIEEVDDPLMDGLRSLQVSIFMSPLNVHINRVPVNGQLMQFNYHPGKYLPAWNPKSSQENERTSMVIKSAIGDIGLKQIAGAMAKRIVCYKQEPGMDLIQGEELGFIKFGSRVDLLLPLGIDLKVKIGDRVKGNVDIIAVKSS